MKTCTQCGKKLIGRQKYYCSDYCRKKEKNKRATEGVILFPQNAEKYCCICGGKFKAKFGVEVTCGDVCWKENRRRTKNRYRKTAQKITKTIQERKSEYAREASKQLEDLRKIKAKKRISSNHTPTVLRILDMRKTKRAAVARFEESVGGIDREGRKQLAELEKTLERLGVKA